VNVIYLVIFNSQTPRTTEQNGSDL